MALRLAIGWHFYAEGTKKLRQEDHFTSAHFLRAAVGPLAPSFKAMAPEPHGWDRLLASPRDDISGRAERAKEAAEWEKQQSEAEKKAKADETTYERPVPPRAPYTEWAQQVLDDWTALVKQFETQTQLTDDQKLKAGEAFAEVRQQFLDCLEADSDAIAEYRHELFRLDAWRHQDAAGKLPYLDARIAEKKAKTGKDVRVWVSDAAAYEAQLKERLQNLLTKEQQERLANVVQPSTLEKIDRAVPYWHVAVGGLLIVGLFSRLAAFGAAVFLASVVATQPPWVPGAVDVYYQVVELCAALALTFIPSGRWAGLDFFLHAMCRRCCSE